MPGVFIIYTSLKLLTTKKQQKILQQTTDIHNMHCQNNHNNHPLHKVEKQDYDQKHGNLHAYQYNLDTPGICIDHSSSGHNSFDNNCHWNLKSRHYTRIHRHIRNTSRLPKQK